MSAFGSISTLTGGTATLNRVVPQQYFYVQNCDTAILTVDYQNPTGTSLGKEVLNPALISGQGGGYVDSIDNPMFLDATAVVLTSAIATAKIASGASARTPTYVANTGVSGAPAR